MRQIRSEIAINPLRNREQINKRENRPQTHYDRLSLICFAGGIPGILLGFVLLCLGDAADKAHVAWKYRAFAVLFTAAVLLGCGAHFMDKSDDEKRQISKLKIERFDRNEVL